MLEENFTTEGLVDGTHVMPATPEVAVGSETKTATDATAAITLEELNKTLGKQFTSKESALKAFSDTFSYVGKKREDVEKEVMSKLQKESQDTSLIVKELKEMKKDMFYKDNPTLAPYRKVLDQFGDNPLEVVNMEHVKPLLEKVRGFDESQSLKTVLETNPRIAASRDSLSRAKELTQKGATKAEIEAEILKSLR